MKKIYFLLIAAVLATSVVAKTVRTEPVINIAEKLKTFNLTAQQMIVELGEIGIDNNYSIGLVKGKAEIIATPQKSKSAFVNAQCLDSLLIEQWNDSTGQIEPYQLERWTWNDKGQSDTWELYDWDISLNQWVPNDKEQYEWDENGNKILHMDFDPDSISGEWFITGKNDREFDEKGNQIYYDFASWNAGNNEWTIESKSTTTYNENGSYLHITQKINPTSNKLQNEMKEEIINDENGNSISASLHEWDNIQSTWNPVIQNTFTYDSNGNRIVEEWVMDSYFMHAKIEKSYDSFGNLTSEVGSFWDYFSNQFNYSEKKDYSFTNDSVKTKYQHSTWNSTTLNWKLISEYNYLYNANSDLQYKVYAKMDTISKALKLQTRKEYVYNDENEINGEINTLWDTVNARWINLTKLEFAKNEAKQLTYEANFTWDLLSADWRTETVENHIYDSSGNLIKNNYFGIDTLTNQLFENWSSDYSYDMSVLFSDLIYPAEFESWHISKLKRFKQYSNVMLEKSYAEIKNNQLTVTELLTFFSSEEMQTAIQGFASENEFKVYPNPASDYVVFCVDNSLKTNTVELYNLQGNKISTQQLPSNNQISVSHLKAGMYIYKIMCDSKISSGKITVN